MAGRRKFWKQEAMYKGLYTAEGSYQTGTDLTSEERKCLSVAYHNLITSLRDARRVVHSIEQEEEGGFTRQLSDFIPYFLASDYRCHIEAELTQACGRILKLLKDLIPFASSAESKVFYLKTKGDYHRYMAELNTESNRKHDADDAKTSYKEAQFFEIVENWRLFGCRDGLLLCSGDASNVVDNIVLFGGQVVAETESISVQWLRIFGNFNMELKVINHGLFVRATTSRVRRCEGIRVDLLLVEDETSRNVLCFSFLAVGREWGQRETGGG
ncbi:hypothetical protein Dimus_018460 [Dionaea muscipula]